MKIFSIEKERCSRDGKLCCFHVKIFGYYFVGRKDGNWYLEFFGKTIWLKKWRYL